ncbi:MAG: chromosomal replication initiator protein DnaA [Saprospiraceae bacterium]
MAKTHDEVWRRCMEYIRMNINPNSFNTWFEPIKAVSLDKKSLTIQVPNQFFFEWLEENYVVLLKKTIKRELGNGAKLEYQIVVENHKDMMNGIQNSKQTEKYSTSEIKNPFVIPGIKIAKIEPQLNENYKLTNFIEGDCNKLARAAGKAISANPGKTAFNPLVIYGDVGLGKTHLANAIGNSALEAFPDLNVLYVTTERFTNQIVDAIKKNELSELTQFYQGIDLLIVDDIQFLAGRTKTQEIFFNIFNQLHQSGKQIVMTSDKPPKMLEGIQSRLISRFKWGLSADLQEPEFETRLAILASKLENEGIDFPAEVKDYVCFNVSQNIRELEGVIVSLIAQSTLNNKVISLDLAQSVINSYVTSTEAQLTVENIKKLVAEHFSLPIEKLISKTRKRDIVIARQLSMYLAKNHTSDSLKQIGANFGGRDHSTVIYSCKTVKDLMDTDLLFRDTVQELERKVKLQLNRGNVM